MTDRNEYIRGLRELADWLENNADVDVPYVKTIAVPLTTNTRVADFATAAGLEVVTDDDGNTKASVHFGALTYYGYGYADFPATDAKYTEQNARTWADKNNMTIQPREGGDES